MSSRHLTLEQKRRKRTNHKVNKWRRSYAEDVLGNLTPEQEDKLWEYHALDPMPDDDAKSVYGYLKSLLDVANFDEFWRVFNAHTR